MQSTNCSLQEKKNKNKNIGIKKLFKKKGDLHLTKRVGKNKRVGENKELQSKIPKPRHPDGGCKPSKLKPEINNVTFVCLFQRCDSIRFSLDVSCKVCILQKETSKENRCPRGNIRVTFPV